MTAALPQAVRIGKLVRLLSSDKSREVLAAVAAIQRIANLHDIAECIEQNWREPVVVDLFGERRHHQADHHHHHHRHHANHAGHCHHHQGGDHQWQTLAAELLRHEHDPRIVWGSRERDFLKNMKLSQTEPSPGQWKWLRDISNRRAAA